MFHLSYQNGGKILSIEKPPEGEDDSGTKKHLAQFWKYQIKLK